MLFCLRFFGYHQWPKVTICPPPPPPLLIFLPPSQKIYCPKNKKKVATFFFGFSYRLFAAPGAFRSNAKLTEIWSIFLPSRMISCLKNSKLGNMLSPSGAAPLHSEGSRGGRYATGYHSPLGRTRSYGHTAALILCEGSRE